MKSQSVSKNRFYSAAPEWAAAGQDRNSDPREQINLIDHMVFIAIAAIAVPLSDGSKPSPVIVLSMYCHLPNSSLICHAHWSLSMMAP